MMEYLDPILRYVVVPIAGFVFVMYQKQQSHSVDIAVLKSELAKSQQMHDRELGEFRATLRSIMEKLNSIEEALRK